ncbi:peptidylprolyl isomerase [Pararcticibacter amylolyticus]|uniref:PpiC domain-containing protein n=1 Tax=Pararcticibacter amylolyticus TaxID=2173175 RepID=A0A2U2PIR1_9SPHI|nr:peptidylprolyl isomerase [Pararcticibacter amylolyticus]PWG81296.1 hypothetical protein DDR33_07950 [Pararcticibacter amylolyticus]
MNNKCFLVVVIVSLLFSCTHSTKDESFAANKVVLSVGKVGITEYELEKNLKLFKDAYRDTANQQPSVVEIKKWIEGFVDRTYFLADAYEKGYYKRQEVTQGVASMERLIISQRKGLLEQFMLNGKLTINKKELELARERSRKKISIEYLRFEDFDAAKHFIGGVEIKGSEKFREAVDNSRKHNAIFYEEKIIEWPFTDFSQYHEYLFNLKEGEVTPILTMLDGCYLFYIKDIAISKNGTPDNEIIQKLKFQKEAEIIAGYKKEVDSNTNVIYNSDVLSKFGGILSSRAPLHKFEKKDFSDILSLDAFTYILKQKRIRYTVSDLINYYNYLPLKPEIRNIEQIGEIIRSMVYSEYSYLKAKECGITADPKFILDRENYQKNLIYDYYETEQLKSSVKLSKEDISGWYNKHRSEYVQPVGVNVSIFSFKDSLDRNKGFSDILRYHNDKLRASQIKVAESIQWNINSSYRKPVLSERVMQRLLLSKNGQVLPPIELAGKYSVIIKNYDYGQLNMQLDEVKELIAGHIKSAKLKEVKEGCLTLLKPKYPCENKIEYKKYL